LVHISKKEEYDAGHITGAQYLEYHDISTPHGAGLMLELPPMAQLVSVFEKIGISNKSRVILYFDNDWVSPTTRVYWTLDTMGLGPRTSILDGGLPAWRAAGKPVTTEVKTATKGSITPEQRTDIFADAAWVSSHLNQPNITILDARHREFYTGEKSDGNPRQGHIPGASNLSFLELVDEQSSKFKSPDAIRALFKNAGLKPGNVMVSYCHIGQRATVLYFAAKMLGYDARMYDGSWDEWSKRGDLPIVRGDKPGTP
jgi:thiosulfate/3-mercaptopyruvate sulfurtransferase